MSCANCRGYDSASCPTCGENLVHIDCPVCDGDGQSRKALNIHTRKTTEVTEIVWQLLPECEEEAEAKGWNFCRAEEPCPFCKGLGFALQNDKGEYFPLL